MVNMIDLIVTAQEATRLAEHQIRRYKSRTGGDWARPGWVQIEVVTITIRFDMGIDMGGCASLSCIMHSSET